MHALHLEQTFKVSVRSLGLAQYSQQPQLGELLVYDIRVLLPFIFIHPHLRFFLEQLEERSRSGRCACTILTFLNVLKPARMLPPVHVVYLRSGGANILIRMSFTANLWTSCSSRSPNPFVSVDPPDSTMLPYSCLRRSISVRWIASTTIWCTPGYSRPISSGLNSISGARKRSGPSYPVGQQMEITGSRSSYLDGFAIRQGVFDCLAFHSRGSSPLLFLFARV